MANVRSKINHNNRVKLLRTCLVQTPCDVYQALTTAVLQFTPRARRTTCPSSQTIVACAVFDNMRISLMLPLAGILVFPPGNKKVFCKKFIIGDKFVVATDLFELWKIQLQYFSPLKGSAIRSHFVEPLNFRILCELASSKLACVSMADSTQVRTQVRTQIQPNVNPV